MTAVPEELMEASEPREPPGGSRGYLALTQARLLAYSSVIAGFLGIMSTAQGQPVVQSLSLLVLMSVGAGSALLCWVKLPISAVVAGVIGLSLAAVVILTTSLARWDAWHPKQSCLVLSLVVASSGLVRLRTLRGRAKGVAGRHWRGSGGNPYYAVGFLILALGIWSVALPMLERDVSGQYGLLGTAGGAVLMLAMAAAVASFVAAIIASRGLIAALAVLVTVFVSRLTATLITEVPIYSYTYKHIGVVDYLMEHRALAPYWTDIYVRWPGFFTAMAWFSSITGLDPVDAAHWFAPVADVLIAAVVGALALAFTRSVRAALVAALLVQLVNWVGQDYYSPQALSLIMAFSILTLLFCSRRSAAAGYLSILIFAAVVAMHQLTPVWVCIVAFTLAVFRLLKPRWLPVAYLGIWAVYVIPRLDSVMRYGIFNFDPVANSAGTTTSARAQSDGYQFTVLVDRGLTVTIWLLAACSVIVLWRRREKPWIAAVFAFSPMLLLGGQSYGGEATMRIFLYSLAGCTALIAPFVVRALAVAKPSRSMLSRAGVWVVLTVFAIAGMHGFYSSWSFSPVTRAQLDQSRELLASNRDYPVITVWASGWPERPSRDYVKFALADSFYDVTLDELRHSILEDVPDADDMDELERGPNETGYPMYVVLPRQLYQYDAWVGLFKPGVLDGLKHQITTRPGWSEEINDADTVVYRYTQDQDQDQEPE